MHKSQQILASELLKASKMVKVGGFYSHYKNPGHIYEVLELAIIESNEEICVVYKARYDEKLTFVRPLKSWLADAELNGKLVRRFTLQN